MGYLRKVTIGTVNFWQWKYVTINLDELSRPVETSDAALAVQASAALPTYFKPVFMGSDDQSEEQHRMLDGGAIVNMDVKSAIERCLEVVNDPANIILDAISLNG